MKVISRIKENKKYRMLFAAILSFAGVWGLPEMLHMKENALGFTNSIISVFVWIAVTFLMDRILQHPFVGRQTKWLIPGILSVFFVVCMVFGTNCDLKGYVPFTNKRMWISILLLICIFTLVIRYYFDVMISVISQKQTIVKIRQNTHEKSSYRYFLQTMAVLLLCYLPVFLAVYPGFFVYDAGEELMQVITRNFTEHHPLIHVLLLGGTIQLIYKISGSYNLGIACFILLQQLLLSGIYSYCICLMKKRGISRKVRIAVTLYFGLFPVIVMFTLCSTKDAIFMGMLLLQFVLLQELFKHTEGFLKSPGKIILFSASSVGMMLLRHNGFYAYLVFVPCFLWLIHKNKKMIGKTLLLLLIPIAIHSAVSNSLTIVFNAARSGNQEMLTVPIQQLARVYNAQKESLSESEKETLYEILPEQALLAYQPKLSDGVKAYFNNTAYEKEPEKYTKLWVKWGLEHSFTYLNAWFMTSYGFWYPDTVIDVYKGNSMYTFTYEDSSYFGFEVESPGIRESKFPWLMEQYRKMSHEIAQQKIPVVSMLFSPGFLFWIFAFCLCFLLYRGRRDKTLPYLLPALVWLTAVLGPTYLVRYVVFLWVLLPFLLSDVWEEAGDRMEEDRSICKIEK